MSQELSVSKANRRPYVHIWALPAKENALRDRVGVFSRDDGVFLIEGLDPGEYAFWAQPIASQGANQWVMSRGGLTDLDDTLVGSLRPCKGRTNDRECRHLDATGSGTPSAP